MSWAILGLLEAPVKQGIDDAARVLMDLGITPNLKGYGYLRAAVTIVANEGMPKRGVCRELYPRVAKQEGTTPSRVERSIRHAVEQAFNRSDPDTLESMFGSSADPGRGKLTNSEFISSVALYLSILSDTLVQKFSLIFPFSRFTGIYTMCLFRHKTVEKPTVIYGYLTAHFLEIQILIFYRFLSEKPEISKDGARNKIDLHNRNKKVRLFSHHTVHTASRCV